MFAANQKLHELSYIYELYYINDVSTNGISYRAPRSFVTALPRDSGRERTSGSIAAR